MIITNTTSVTIAFTIDGVDYINPPGTGICSKTYPKEAAMLAELIARDEHE